MRNVLLIVYIIYSGLQVFASEPYFSPDFNQFNRKKIRELGIKILNIYAIQEGQTDSLLVTKFEFNDYGNIIKVFHLKDSILEITDEFIYGTNENLIANFEKYTNGTLREQKFFCSDFLDTIKINNEFGFSVFPKDKSSVIILNGNKIDTLMYFENNKIRRTESYNEGLFMFSKKFDETGYAFETDSMVYYNNSSIIKENHITDRYTRTIFYYDTIGILIRKREIPLPFSNDAKLKYEEHIKKLTEEGEYVLYDPPLIKEKVRNIPYDLEMHGDTLVLHHLGNEYFFDEVKNLPLWFQERDNQQSMFQRILKYNQDGICYSEFYTKGNYSKTVFNENKLPKWTHSMKFGKTYNYYFNYVSK